MVSEKDAKLTGRFLEKIGIYVPRPGKEGKDSLQIDSERFTYWTKLGAQPSPRLATLLKTHKIDLGATATPAAPKEAKVAKPATAAAPKAAKPASAAVAPAKKAAPKKKA